MCRRFESCQARFPKVPVFPACEALLLTRIRHVCPGNRSSIPRATGRHEREPPGLHHTRLGKAQLISQLIEKETEYGRKGQAKEAEGHRLHLREGWGRDRPVRSADAGGQDQAQIRSEKDKKEVASKLAKAIADRDSGVVSDPENMTVGEYPNRWLDAVRGTVRERTWRRNEVIVSIHLKLTLDGTKLDKLDALKVQTLYGAKLESGLSARTVQIIHTTLHKALKQAVRWSLISRNVTEAVDPPRPSAKEIRPPGVE